MENKETQILRVKAETHKKAKEIAKENHMTISGFTEIALNNLIDEYRYNLERLMENIAKHPRLSLFAKIIREELDNNPPRYLIKDIMKMMEEGEIGFHKLIFSEDNKKRIADLLSKKDEKTILILKYPKDTNIDHVFDYFSKFLGKNKIKFILKGVEGSKNIEVIIFHSF
jgi:hypothetical protein